MGNRDAVDEGELGATISSLVVSVWLCSVVSENWWIMFEVARFLFLEGAPRGASTVLLRVVRGVVLSVELTFGLSNTGTVDDEIIWKPSTISSVSVMSIGTFVLLCEPLKIWQSSFNDESIPLSLSAKTSNCSSFILYAVQTEKRSSTKQKRAKGAIEILDCFSSVGITR